MFKHLIFETIKIGNQVKFFVGIGLIGFIVDGSVLTFLSKNEGMNIYLSRIISFSLASFTTWQLNRKFTFRVFDNELKTSPVIEYLSYIVIQVIGSLINLGLFSLLIFGKPELKATPIFPLAVGAIFAMIFNYLGLRKFVYK